jgi:hypothetical protein
MHFVLDEFGHSARVTVKPPEKENPCHHPPELPPGWEPCVYEESSSKPCQHGLSIVGQDLRQHADEDGEYFLPVSAPRNPRFTDPFKRKMNGAEEKREGRSVKNDHRGIFSVGRGTAM